MHADLRIGEEVRLSGSVPALGCDDPERSIPMVTTPGDFPWWRTKEGKFELIIFLLFSNSFKELTQ